MYEFYGFTKKKKTKLCRYVECKELRKSNRKLCALDVQIVWICRKFEYPELHKLIGKLCTLYVQIV